jgi:CheY-like chemotaxis protein/two-component sensor histidine kinase
MSRRARAVIRRQTDQLTRLIEDLLDITRLSRGKIKLRLKYIDLAEVVRRAAEDHREMLAEGDLTLQLDVAPGPVWAEADPTRITQVVGNLLHNVAKFTPSGGCARLSLRPSVGGQIEIRVQDNGVGIDPQLRERLFEPFVQSEHSLARTRGGLGLGLALVRGILELHGGTARVESAGVGKGAEFILRIPSGAKPQIQHSTTGRAQDTTNMRRVLVVDDNRDAAESLADLVKLFGHEAKALFDGAGALVEVLVNPPDILLCDLGLPGLDGYEVARRIREHLGRSIQLIAISGYAQPGDVDRAIRSGFDAHIAKPADPAAIDRLLRTSL